MSTLSIARVVAVGAVIATALTSCTGSDAGPAAAKPSATTPGVSVDIVNPGRVPDGAPVGPTSLAEISRESRLVVEGLVLEIRSTSYAKDPLGGSDPATMPVARIRVTKVVKGSVPMNAVIRVVQPDRATEPSGQLIAGAVSTAPFVKGAKYLLYLIEHNYSPRQASGLYAICFWGQYRSLSNGDFRRVSSFSPGAPASVSSADAERAAQS